MAGSNRRILIVDDHPQLTEMFSLMVADSGFSSMTASNGHDALLRIGDTPPDLILSDVQMPVMNGREFLIEIKRHFRDTKVIMMSGDTFNADEFRVLGALDLLPKPIRFPALIRLLQNAVSTEKRSTVRLKTVLPVSTGTGSGLSTVNISSDGMLLQGSTGLPPGAMAPFTIRSPFHARTLLTHGTIISERTFPAADLTAVRFTGNIGPALLPLLQDGTGTLRL